jgi:hypothetical protein
LLSSLLIAILPLNFRADFGAMTPFLNIPTVAMLGALGVWALVLWRKGGPAWPFPDLSASSVAGAVRVALAFWCMNVQIASFFKEAGTPFSFAANVRMDGQLAFDLGWLGFALLLLFSPIVLRIPLGWLGFALLALATVRLALIPLFFRLEFGAVPPIVNAPTLGLLALIGSWALVFWRKGGPTWDPRGMDPRRISGFVLVALCFWFMNVQIASVLKESGAPFGFETKGFLARQLGYSIGWLLFGIVLLGLGLSRGIKNLRLAGLGLLMLAAFKVFVGDLWSLGGLYRVGSLVGLAAVLILASFLYQKFEKGDNDAKRSK